MVDLCFGHPVYPHLNLHMGFMKHLVILSKEPVHGLNTQNNLVMKELTKTELIQTYGGEISLARKAGRAFGEFLGVTFAVAIFVADVTVDVIKTVLK